MNLLPVFVNSFEFGDFAVRLEQESKVGIGGTVWEASFYLAKCIHRNKKEILEGVSHIVELGAGTGLCGLACAYMDESIQVTITDQESHMELIEQNIGKNELSNVNGGTLDWKSPKSLGKVDLVIGADLVYETGLFDPLLDTLDTICGEHTKVLMCNELRTPNDLNFYRKAMERGWTLTKFPDYLIGKEFAKEMPIFKFSRL